MIDVVVTDQTGLFEKITGALAVTGLNILVPEPSPERTMVSMSSMWKEWGHC